MFVTATDAKGATTEALPQFGTIGLQGRYRLDVGEPRFPPHDDYVVFSVDLRQSLTQVTGTILDRWGHHGTIDPAQPGTLDAEGRFRLRFKIESDADLEVAGVLTAPWGDMRQHQLVGEGQVTGERYRDWPVKLWREARH